ncbi:MAG: hypothetical protein ACRDCB_14400 [Clostridium sp.]
MKTLTKKIKDEGVRGMKSIREEFLNFSREELTEDDLYTIKEITNSRIITSETVPDLLLALQSHLLLAEEGKTEINTEFTEKISMLVTKLQNNKFGVLDKAKRYFEMRNELDEYIDNNGLYYLSKLKDEFEDDLSISKGIVYLGNVHRIGKVSNIKDVDIVEDYDSDTPFEKCEKVIMIQRYRGKDSTLIITYNPYQKIVDKKQGREFLWYHYNVCAL